MDRTLTILSNVTKDAVPTDRIKLLSVKGVLLARQGPWLEAEHDLSTALAMADQEPWLDPVTDLPAERKPAKKWPYSP
jgi:hypothetical protein